LIADGAKKHFLAQYWVLSLAGMQIVSFLDSIALKKRKSYQMTVAAT
jgi:hypothetical protein